MAYLMGIDYGTGGAKACIINTLGEVLGFSYQEYPIIHKQPGWSEHDPNLYWKIVCQLVRQTLAQSRIDSKEIHGIAVSSALPSMVMVDDNHQPIERAYNLMDRRAVKEVEWLKNHIGEEIIYNLSGYRLDDHPNLVNILWEKNNRPNSFKRIHKVLTIDGYITLKLTGKAVLNHSGAAFYGVAFNLRRAQFDSSMMNELGLPFEIIPELHHCTDIIGEVTPQAAGDTGLVPGIPVVAGQVDCNASWLGAGAIDIGDFQSNLGSVGNFGIIYNDIDFIFSEIGQQMMNFPYTIDGMYITVPTTITGGQSIRFIRDTFSQFELETERVLKVSSYDLLNLQAEKVPIGSEGLIILPFLMGERTPIWDIYARGVIFGLSLNHTKGHLVRAMMEAVAFAMYDSFRLIKKAGLKVNYPMILNEGGAVSRLWRKIISDVFNVPIILVKRRTGAPYGDAILAGVGTGVLKDFSVAKQWFEGIEPTEPDQENHDKYMECFSLYKEIYEHLKGDFRTLAKLRNKLI